MTKIKDLTVEELEQIIRDVVREELLKREYTADFDIGIGRFIGKSIEKPKWLQEVICESEGF